MGIDEQTTEEPGAVTPTMETATPETSAPEPLEGTEHEAETGQEPTAEAAVADPAPADPAPAAKAPRRRPARRDEVLEAAVEVAREGLAGLAEPGQIGEHLGVGVDDDRLMTHRFAAALPGYRGWEWYSTLARAPRSKVITVCEVGLAAGEDAIVAPPWVPYADRVSEDERARLQAVAEGRDPDAPLEEAERSDEGTPEDAASGGDVPDDHVPGEDAGSDPAEDRDEASAADGSEEPPAADEDQASRSTT